MQHDKCFVQGCLLYLWLLMLDAWLCQRKVPVHVSEQACKCAQTLRETLSDNFQLIRDGRQKDPDDQRQESKRTSTEELKSFCSPTHTFLLCADLASWAMLGVLIHHGLSKVERQCCLAVSVARKEASFVIDILSLSSALAFCQLLIVYTCLFSIHKGFYKFLSVRCHSTSFPLVIGTP